MPTLRSNPKNSLYTLLDRLHARLSAQERRTAGATYLLPSSGASSPLSQTVVTGGAANAILTAAGVAANAEIVGAIMFAAGVPSNITSTITVPSAGHIKSTTATTGNTIVLTYVNPAS